MSEVKNKNVCLHKIFVAGYVHDNNKKAPLPKTTGPLFVKGAVDYVAINIAVHTLRIYILCGRGALMVGLNYYLIIMGIKNEKNFPRRNESGIRREHRSMEG
ncbi:hypothetical protein [Ruminococcus albus]|uniref:hypothetical protein n=1 Tax=Ruminococcus albus TaxID=1264 RepID=UPI000463E40F|nr:hypothetical protein [Ruminococcus albus]